MFLLLIFLSFGSLKLGFCAVPCCSRRDYHIEHLSLDSLHLQPFEEIFIIGDVHGCYEELITLLTKANALSDNVLKIFTGDLVRKGPYNEQVLDLVRESKSMLSVRGNHDQIALDEYLSLRSDNNTKVESWMRFIKTENVQFLQHLPYTISILPLNIIVVHAGLMPGLEIHENGPYLLTNMRNIKYVRDDESKCMEGTRKTIEGLPWSTLWEGPQHVYFGHDSRRMLQLRPHATGIDTGCVYGEFLTGVFIKGPRKGTFYRAYALNQYATHSN